MVKNRGGENGMIFPGGENGISLSQAYELMLLDRLLIG